MVIPFREPRVEHGRVSDLPCLPVIGRCGWRPIAQTNHQSRPVLAKLPRQRDPRFKAVKQGPVRQWQRHADRDTEDLGRSRRLGQPHLGRRANRCRLTVGQINNAHGVTRLDQGRQRPATSNLHIVGMSPDSNHIQSGNGNTPLFN